VPVNCGAIPENLMESEFFGYKKGLHRSRGRPRRLFPGCARRYPVPHEVAICRCPCSEAAARDFREAGAQGGRDGPRTGGRAHDLRYAPEPDRLVEAGTFRQDLYFRLNVIN